MKWLNIGLIIIMLRPLALEESDRKDTYKCKVCEKIFTIEKDRRTNWYKDIHGWCNAISWYHKLCPKCAYKWVKKNNATQIVIYNIAIWHYTKRKVLLKEFREILKAYYKISREVKQGIQILYCRKCGKALTIKENKRSPNFHGLCGHCVVKKLEQYQKLMDRYEAQNLIPPKFLKRRVKRLRRQAFSPTLPIPMIGRILEDEAERKEIGGNI